MVLVKTMNHKFPNITHIDQVKKVVEGIDEFVVAERDDYTVINYLISNDTTFPPVEDDASAIRRECRGLIFDKTGKLLSRPFHKFFNVNERDETHVSKIDFSRPHVILEKLDGSMLRPIYVNGRHRMATKMGITDIALQVEEFIKDKPVYTEFFDFCHQAEITPIFEWISRKNRIVIDYSVDELILLAMRDNETGEYFHYSILEWFSWKYEGIGIVRQYPGNAESMQSLIDTTKDLVGAEGFVVRFDDGHMVKVKGEWYVQIHKAKDKINQEKNLIQMILDDNIDDLKPFLLQSDLDRLNQYVDGFWHHIHNAASSLKYDFDHCYVDSRKEFALNIQRSLPSREVPLMFKLYDGAHAFDVLIETIKKNLGTQKKVDSVRWIFGVEWNEQLSNE